jgi:excisionase family DNA binding protein
VKSPEEHLSLREAADTLGISEVSARRWVKAGRLKAYQPGRKYLVPMSAVEELLEETQAPKATAPSPEEASGGERRVDSKPPPVTVNLESLVLSAELKPAIVRILESVATGEISVEEGVEEVWKEVRRQLAA